MKSFVTRTFAAGVFLLIPLFCVGYVVINVFKVLRRVAMPVVEKLDIDRVLGVLFLDAIAICLLLLLIFGLGLVAHLPAISHRVSRLDRLLSDRVAGYTMIKGIISGVLQEDTSVSSLQTVLVRYNDTARLGFEVERTENGGVVVFMPNTPNPQTGTAAAFEPENVERLDIAPHKATEMLNFFGKGVSGAVETARQQRGTD